MSTSWEPTCELVQFRVEESRLLHIAPRPGRDAPRELEQILGRLLREALEVDIHSCPHDCDCVIGEPQQVEAREQTKRVSHESYKAWYRVRLVKYRTRGECMPKADELPPEAGSRV